MSEIELPPGAPAWAVVAIAAIVVITPFAKAVAAWIRARAKRVELQIEAEQKRLEAASTAAALAARPDCDADGLALAIREQVRSSLGEIMEAAAKVKPATIETIARIDRHVTSLEELLKALTEDLRMVQKQLDRYIAFQAGRGNAPREVE